MAEDRTFEVGDVAVKPGERGFTRLSVTTLLVGQPLAIPMHVINGAGPGPTLGILSATHGTEYPTVRILREIHALVDPAELSGTLLMIPVGNPITFASRLRKSHIFQWDYSHQDMNRVFPGRVEVKDDGSKNHPSNHNVTQLMARVVAENLIDRCDYFLDYHTCGMLGRFVQEVPMVGGLPPALRPRTLELSLALNLGIIYEHPTGTGTATGYAGKVRGIPATTGEWGGVSENTRMEGRSVRLGVEATLNVLRYLRMIPGEAVIKPKQFLYHYQSQVRPTKAGYLLSRIDSEAVASNYPFGVEVKAGDVLGTVFDPYTFQEVEVLRAAVDGLVVIPMRDGPVEAGDLGFIVADYRDSEIVG